MGYWAYCRHPGCFEPVPEPTIREVIADEQYCADGHKNLATMSRDDVLLELVERIEALEAEVAALRQQPLP